VSTQKNSREAGYMISAVAELYNCIHNAAPLRTRRFAETSRSDGNTRLYTDSDLERLEVIITLARDMGVNLAALKLF